MSGDGCKGHAAGVSENECGASITVLEDTLHCRLVGSVLSDENLEAIQESSQPLGKGRGFSEYEDAIVDVGDSTTRTFDEAPPTQSSAWVDA
jgi:hypothetical protein